MAWSPTFYSNQPQNNGYQSSNCPNQYTSSTTVVTQNPGYSSSNPNPYGYTNYTTPTTVYVTGNGQPPHHHHGHGPYYQGHDPHDYHSDHHHYGPACNVI